MKPNFFFTILLVCTLFQIPFNSDARTLIGQSDSQTIRSETTLINGREYVAASSLVGEFSAAGSMILSPAH